MNGQVLEEQRSFPTGAVVAFIFAAVLIFGSLITQVLELAAIAILPVIIGVALLIGRPTPFRAQLVPGGMILEPTGEQIPFGSIFQLVFVGSKTAPDRGSIVVQHAQGEFIIPERLTTPTPDLYEYLRANTHDHGIMIDDPTMLDFYRQQAGVFGAQQVWVHTARPQVKMPQPRWGRYVGPAMLLTALIWLFLGVVRHEAWLYFGIVLLIVTPFIWGLGYRKPKAVAYRSDTSGLAFALMFGVVGAIIWENSRAKKGASLATATLIVSPAHIALSQGDLQGQLQWSDITAIKQRRSSWISSTIGPRIELRVEGAKMEIMDVYATPLVHIYDQIQHYWSAG